MTSVTGAPSWTIERAAQVASQLFDRQGPISPLPSERDQNFLIGGDRPAVLKVANAEERRELLEAENAALTHLADLRLCPTLIPAGDAGISAVDGHLVRMISLVPGTPLGRIGFHTPRLLQSLGRSIATVTRSLATFDHPALHRVLRWDLALADATLSEAANQPIEGDMAATIAAVQEAYREALSGRTLRTSIVHHDANDFNVLADAGLERVTGIIDFGDMVSSHTVNDLAVACAYAMLDKADPLATAAEVVRGWHEVYPLTDDEVAVVWTLALARLAMSVCIAAQQLAARPDNDYLGVSQGPITRTLPRAVAIHPRLAHYTMRAACGVAAVPHSPRVVEWLGSNQTSFASPTGHDLRHGPVAPIDLSAGSTLVSTYSVGNAPIPMWERVRQVMEAYGAPVGAGGYGEARLVYGGEAFGTGAVTELRRTVHTGLDLSLPAGSPLHAPIAGVVHGFEFADHPYDYGPVITLRHTIPATADEPSLDFYTLWGHLAESSLDDLVVGQRVVAGERFARVGAAPTNGNWWPHTHMQIITDMLDVAVNFNGACRPGEWDTWTSICPDPNLILGIPPAGLPEPTPTAGALSERRTLRTGANLSISYGQDALQICRGRGQYLFDDVGRCFIDAYNNVAHVGHGHPRVVEAVSRQLGVLNTNTRYLQRQLLDYADALAETLPTGLEVVYLTASGSEANELALRLARAATGRSDVIVMHSAYHGHTTGLIDVSPYKHAGPGGKGAPAWVHTVDTPDTYRGRYRDPATAGAAYARDVAALIGALTSRGLPPGAFLAETCPSVGGQIMLPSGYLSGVYQAVRAAGGVCIADEVQTGFGRLGSSFWAFETHGVTPDIVVLGKPIANGYPVGAVVTTRAVAEAFDNGMEFFSTFGGSTAACVAAHETLRVTHDEGLQAHAAAVGERLLDGFRTLQLRHSSIGDVRGSGLFLGLDLVNDPATREPSPLVAAHVVRSLRAQHVLAGIDGPHHNVIKLRGPMPLSCSDADLVLDALDRALTGLS